ncbi:condensin subunit Smc [Archaeoglobus sulfaticallidus PM70-1]|uniref:Chromosome partition protein Smc n=1 Tax=Archaeoglobus sulfaticallidus PM70-1 TaxID=387631 RepID=N0BKP2_9EURY|nr:chromosome segregation protein SMC [Archaeoglobus sulfaticallidus]AGK60780.1 condensin subunit Smc [Archaeoglobus sulfaticallidus PM70-1]
MYIKKIVLKNFKSFNKKVEIPFFKGFTVISGPNGSGKSNIVDAILFCLGLTPSTRYLRADRVGDLIYSGNGKLGEAEVTVIFDNDGEEIKITRKIKRTSKGNYTYNYLNGKSVNLAEIQRLLQNFGIYSDAYNVVMQGDVTRIAEMTPFQRRKIIDDIAGISEFDEKKAKAIEELEAVRENIERINTILIEVSNQLEQLKADREEALRYKSLIEEKELNLKYLKINKFLSLNRRKRMIKRDIENLEMRKDKILKEIIDINSKLNELNTKADEISAEIYRLADESYKTIQNEIIEISSKREGLKSSIEMKKKEIKDIEDEKTKLLVSISKLKEEVSKVEEELQKFSIQKMSVQEVLDDLESKKSLIISKLNLMDSAYSELRDQLLKKKEILDELKERKSSKVNERDRLLEVIRRIGMEIEDIEGEIETLRKESITLNEELKELNKKYKEVEKELEAAIKRRNEADNKIFSIRNQISSLEEEKKNLEVELSKIKAQLSLLESSFSKAVELILEAKSRKAMPGVFGTVSQLCEVDEKFAVALEVSAGNSLQYLVVENEDDAIRCIKYLKQIDGGRATFIPLNKIKKNFGDIKLDRSVLKEKGVIDYAINLIKCEKKFKPVFNFVYRDTLVVEDIDTAKRLMDGRRIVTLDGDIVERAGTISGGSKQKSKGILATKELFEKEKKLEEEITVIESRKAEMLGNLRLVEEERRIHQSNVEEINSRLSELSSKISVAESKLRDNENRIEELKEKLTYKQKERAEIYERMSGVEEEIEKIDEEIRKISGEIEEIEAKMRGSEIPALTRKLEEIKEEIDRNSRAMYSITKNLENSEFKLQQLKDLVLEKEIKIDELDRKIENLKKEIENDSQLYSELGERLITLKEKEKEVGESVKDLRDKRSKLLAEIKKLEKDRDEKRFEVTGIEETIKAKEESLKDIEEQIRELGEIEYDEEEVQNIPRMEHVKRRLEEIELELKKFGDVNLKAIQDYEEVKARKEELMSKKLTLEKERSEILEKIERYEKMKRDTFFETFNAINMHFKEIISKLAEGEGELYLDNADDPFNSGLYMRVRVRDKPIQKIESMSGGEKSLVALSLIFAIQKFKPAPFYAFDEVDMFLDGINVEKVAKLISERSKNAQFIVVSLRKPMLEKADSIVGVTLSKDNSSTVTGIKMKA